jgi:hypothetical protein
MKTKFQFTDLNAPRYVGIILNKGEHFEIYKEAFAKASEKFGGDSLAYKTITNGISEKNVTGSQFFWNTWLEQSGISLPGKVMLLKDWENALSQDSGLVSGFYTDMPQLILRSDEATFDKNQYLINDLSKKLKGEFEYSPENPLIITGARLKSSKAKENEYGIDLDISNAEIKNDESFAPTNKIIKLGNIEKKLWTKKEGLSRLCLDENDVGSGSGNLADSDSDGRVALLDAIGVVEEKLAEYLIKLQEQKDLQISEIEKKYLEAKSILQNK